eukprot:3510845-Ditylum_brightwellii.AAC.1
MSFNVDKFCNYSTATLKTICNTGYDDNQASLKLYEALVSSNVEFIKQQSWQKTSYLSSPS